MEKLASVKYIQEHNDVRGPWREERPRGLDHPLLQVFFTDAQSQQDHLRDQFLREVLLFALSGVKLGSDVHGALKEVRRRLDICDCMREQRWIQ